MTAAYETWPDVPQGNFQFFAKPLFGPRPEDPGVSRAYVAEGLCPICGAGPFAVVAIHCYRKHGVDRLQLRAMLGVYKTTSICDEGHSAQLRRLGRQRWTPERAAQMAARRPRGKGSRELSEAAKQRNRRLAEQNRGRAAERLSQVHARAHEEALARYEVWRERWDAGLTLAEIAQQFGVRSQAVKLGLRTIGVEIGREGYRRRSQVDGWGREALDRGRETSRKKVAERTAARVARFTALGGDRAALETLAREQGLSAGGMRAALLKAGAAVPDGRQRT